MWILVVGAYFPRMLYDIVGTKHVPRCCTVGTRKFPQMLYDRVGTRKLWFDLRKGLHHVRRFEMHICLPQSLPWYDHNGWLDVKHQVTCLLTYLLTCHRVCLEVMCCGWQDDKIQFTTSTTIFKVTVTVRADTKKIGLYSIFQIIDYFATKYSLTVDHCRQSV